LLLQVPAAPPPTGSIFDDDFETGDISLWDSSFTPNSTPPNGGTLAVTQAAALQGSYGLEITPSSSSPGAPFLVVVDDTPASETEYGAYFHFRPNISLGSSVINLLLLLNEQSQWVGVLRLRQQVGGEYQLRFLTFLNNGTSVQAPDDGWATIGPYFNYAGVSVQWGAASAPGASDGYIELSINGQLLGRVDDLDNDEKRIGKAWFGLAGGPQGLPGVSGSYDLDDFSSSSGPVPP